MCTEPPHFHCETHNLYLHYYDNINLYVLLQLLRDIVLELQMLYVAVVSTEDDYGIQGSNEFLKVINDTRVCIAAHLTFSNHDTRQSSVIVRVSWLSSETCNWHFAVHAYIIVTVWYNITRASEWVITVWRSCKLFLCRDIS